MKNLFILFLLLAISACRHPLKVEGEGSIVERIYGLRGCSFAEFKAKSNRCTQNILEGERYLVYYEAIPESGWVFDHW